MTEPITVPPDGAMLTFPDFDAELWVQSYAAVRLDRLALLEAALAGVQAVVFEDDVPPDLPVDAWVHEGEEMTIILVHAAAADPAALISRETARLTAVRRARATSYGGRHLRAV